MRWIYISPHFDDAVLSCGGLIWEQTQRGIPVEVWTVNAGIPQDGPISELIARVHASWKTGTPSETVRLRQLEDQEAVKKVGAKSVHLSVIDAIYRQTNKGAFLYTNDVFDPVHPQDNRTIIETASQIGSRLEPKDRVLIPLGLGNHVDHIITRRAVEDLNRPVWYYADIPYFFSHADELAPSIKGLKAKTFAISESGLAAWQAGIQAYGSQLPSLFGNLQNMLSQINEYYLSRNGMILWWKNGEIPA